MLTPVGDISESLERLKGKYGSAMNLAVLPLGPLTIPDADD